MAVLPTSRCAKHATFEEGWEQRVAKLKEEHRRVHLRVAELSMREKDIGRRIVAVEKKERIASERERSVTDRERTAGKAIEESNWKAEHIALVKLGAQHARAGKSEESAAAIDAAREIRLSFDIKQTRKNKRHGGYPFSEDSF